MRVDDIIARVRTTAGDIDVLQFTDDQILTWVNDGIRECAMENNLLQKRATSVTVVGQEDYALPEDILKLHSITIASHSVKIVSAEEASNHHDCLWLGHLWANNLVLSPVPTKEEPLVISYIYSPRTVSKTAEIPLPVGYHSRIVDYCLAQVAQLDDDMSRYQLKMEEFRTGVQNLKFNERSEENLYPSINVSDRNSGDYYYEGY